MFGFLDNLKKSPSLFSSSRVGSSPSSPFSLSSSTFPSTTPATSTDAATSSLPPVPVSFDSPCPLEIAALSPLLHTHLALADSAALQFMAHLECAMCSAIMWAPVKTPCLHMFCYACVKPWVVKSGTCPTCRKEVTAASLVKLEQAGDMLWQTFLTLQVRCVFNEDAGEAACKWKGNYSDVVAHLQQHCVCAPVACPANASHQMPRRDWPEHKKTCDSLPIPCAYCDVSLPRSELSFHQAESCPLVPVDCPNGCTTDGCLTTLPRGELAAHRRVCLQECVRCPLGEACSGSGKVTRASLHAHLSDPLGGHIVQLFTLVQDLSAQVSHLTAELENERRSRRHERPYAARVWFCDVGAWVKPSASSQMPSTMTGVIVGPGRNEGWVRVNWIDGPQNDGCRVGGGDSQLVYTTTPDGSGVSRLSTSSNLAPLASSTLSSVHLHVSEKKDSE